MEKFKKIEHPTGNHAIDWLLESKDHALNTESIDYAIRFLIDKHNELVSALEERSNEASGLHLHSVTNSGEHQNRFCGKCVETTKHKIAMHEYNGAIGEVWKCCVCGTNNAWAS